MSVATGEELVARAGLGDHCERLGGSELEMAELKWGGRGGYEGTHGGNVCRTW